MKGENESRASGRPLERQHILATAAIAMPRPSIRKLSPPRQRVRSPVSLFSLVANVRANLEAIGQAAAGGRILTGASGLGLRAFVHVLNSPNFTIGTHVALCLH